MTTWEAESSMSEMTDEQCWERLDEEEMGRLAFRLVDEVHIVPINYVVDAASLLFRTNPGNKLFAAALHSEVAFEIDHYDDTSAWSVVVRGRLRILEEDEQHRLDGQVRQPWVPTLKYDVMELVPEVVTGRTFGLRRTASASS